MFDLNNNIIFNNYNCSTCLWLYWVILEIKNIKIELNKFKEFYSETKKHI